ncbi:MAG TPA: GTPase, partial [Thermoplasmata archaeon]|nr:GTPase [Thermoplasmata archaeon]
VRSASVAVRHLHLALRPVQPDRINEFQRTLVGRRFGAGSLERAARRVGHAIDRIRRVAAEEQRELDRAADRPALGLAVRRAYGRLASFVREVDPDLIYLRTVERFLKSRPTLDPASPVVTVAGFPNVGKSSLVARLSSARPRIAPYPFTTVALEVGHADLGFDRLQVLDTPGVLDRRRSRNPAELEAEVAVGRAATLVLFVLDPTGACGFPMEDQERLLARWKLEFPRLPILEVETKSDLPSVPSGRRRVSAVTGEGIEELREEIAQRLSGFQAPPPAGRDGAGEEITLEPPRFARLEAPDPADD